MLGKAPLEIRRLTTKNEPLEVEVCRFLAEGNVNYFTLTSESGELTDIPRWETLNTWEVLARNNWTHNEDHLSNQPLATQIANTPQRRLSRARQLEENPEGKLSIAHLNVRGLRYKQGQIRHLVQ